VRWNFGDVGSGADNTSDLNKPAHLFSSAGSFRITAFVDFSCGTDTLEKTISIPECQVSPTTCTLFVPSGFSPNGDGLNDKFKPVCNCTPEVYEWFVYNRWGELLFKSTTTAEQWDGNHKGKNCMPGVYVYRVNYRFPGKPLKQASGNINILR
jgi:gliding motility-associated-like protein